MDPLPRILLHAEWVLGDDDDKLYWKETYLSGRVRKLLEWKFFFETFGLPSFFGWPLFLAPSRAWFQGRTSICCLLRGLCRDMNWPSSRKRCINLWEDWCSMRKGLLSAKTHLDLARTQGQEKMCAKSVVSFVGAGPAAIVWYSLSSSWSGGEPLKECGFVGAGPAAIVCFLPGAVVTAERVWSCGSGTSRYRDSLACTLCIFFECFTASSSSTGMAAAFVKKLAATDKFLGQIKSLPSAAAVQLQQCKQLVEQAGKVSSWSSEEASEACEVVHKLLHVSQESRNQLLEAIAACMAAPANETAVKPIKKSRSLLQDYTNLHYMLTQNVWNYVMDARTTPEQACMILCKFASSLGLTNPSEGTVGIIALLAHWNLWKAQDVPQSSKFLGLQACKPSIKLYLDKYKNERPVPEQERLRVLPEDFHQLPQRVQDAFQGDRPEKPSDVLRAACKTMPLRKTNDAAVVSSGLAKNCSASLLNALKGINAPSADGELKITLVPKALNNGGQTPAAEAVPLPLEDSPTESQSAVATPPRELPAETSKSKTSVESVLESLKQNLAERKLAAEQSKGPKTPAKAKAKPKRKSQPKKNAHKGTEKKGQEKARVAKHDSVQSCKKRTGQVLDDLVFPSWWHSKKDLLDKFPNDTEKRFTSRCYHLVKDFGVKRGLDVEDAKAKGREAHHEASQRWKFLFKPESAWTQCAKLGLAFQKSYQHGRSVACSFLTLPICMLKQASQPKAEKREGKMHSQL